MAKIYRSYAKYKTGLSLLARALERARQTGDSWLESDVLNDTGVDYVCYISLQDQAKESYTASLAIRERVGFRKNTTLGNIGGGVSGRGSGRRRSNTFRTPLPQQVNSPRHSIGDDWGNSIWSGETLRAQNATSCIV